MFIAKTVALNKCPVILTKYVACLVSSTQRVFFSYQCPGLFYTETVFISYLSLIVFIFSTFAIMRVFIGSPVLAAKQVCHPHISFC